MLALSFEHPERAWLLAAGLVVWWLARPLRARSRILTAQIDRWRAALARLGRSRQRPRPLRWILLALAVGAAVVAAAGPRVGARDGARRLTVLLDTTAGMGAREADDTTAFVQAKAALRALDLELPAQVAWQVLTIGEPLRTFRGDRQAVFAQLPAEVEVRPLSSPTALAGLLEAVMTELEIGTDLAVLTLTDARGAATLPTRGALRIVGEPRFNRGIASAVLRDSWPAAELELDLVLFTPKEPVLPELILEGGAELDPRRLAAAHAGAVYADDQWRLSLPLRRLAGGEIRLSLARSGDDALASDDAVVFSIQPPAFGRIGVMHAPDRRLDRDVALAADWLAGQVGAAVSDSNAEPTVPVDVVMLDGVSLAELPPRAVAFGVTLPGATVSESQPARVTGWNRSHPLIEGLDFADLMIEEATTPVSLPAGAEVLVEGEHGPLMALIPTRGGRLLWFAFRPSASNLPLLPAFPQVLLRAVPLLAGPAAGPLTATTGIGVGECDLRRSGGLGERPLPDFADDGTPLAGLALALAALLLALRMWV